MQLQIDIYAEVAEKYGLKNGDTHKFLRVPGFSGGRGVVQSSK